MLKSVGRLFFVGFIWIYALFYYIDCRSLSDVSEKMTISIVFWIFTLFVVLELINLVKLVMIEKGDNPLFEPRIIRKILYSSKTHLIILIIIYLVLIPYVGFYTSSFLAFCAFSYVLGTRGFLKVLLPGSIVLAFIYIVFSMSLKLELPKGLLL